MTTEAVFYDRNAFWATDGTADGTRIIYTAPGGILVSALLAWSNRAMFTASVGTGLIGAYDLFVSDGTATGTVAVVPGASLPGYGTYSVDSLATIGARAIGATLASPETLVVTDGSQAGTQVLSFPTVPAAYSWVIGSPLYPLGNKVVFTAGNVRADYAGLVQDLWVSDGTSAGTRALAVSGHAAAGLQPEDFTVIGSKALFLGFDNTGHNALWVTDGTDAGTFELATAGLPAGTVIGGSPVAFGSRALFVTVNPDRSQSVWATDGTGAGTVRLATTALGTTPEAIAIAGFGARALFIESADGTGRSWSFWITDGTVAGTTQLVVPTLDLDHGVGSLPADAFVYGSKLLFRATDTAGNDALWISDGSSAGTVEITAANSYGYGLMVSGSPEFALAGADVVFNGTDAAGNDGLWVTDGTSAGTHEVSVTSGGTAVHPVMHSSISIAVTDATTPDTPGSLAVLDTTSGQGFAVAGQAYTGPVSGLLDQFIYFAGDGLNVTASTPGWFIHTGSGTDAIAVSSGINVLDGGTGSNFLTGGSGTDTFFVDDRAARADIWSTVVNFHAGDAATIWGVAQAGFALSWADGQGAAGYTGLTLHAAQAGVPTASLTLAGFSQADLASGAITVSFGTDPASGSTYMYVHAG